MEDISTTDDFIDCLFVRLAQYNTEWQGIRCIKDLKGTEVKKRLLEHVRNQKKKDSKINVQINAARALREEATESDCSEMQVLVSDANSCKGELKNDQKVQESQVQHQGTTLPPNTEEEANQHEQEVDPKAHEEELFTVSRRYTAKQLALINTELEIDSVVTDIKACKAKLKTLTKRFEQLKKLSSAHSYNLYEKDD